MTNIERITQKISSLEDKIRNSGYTVSDLLDHPYTGDDEIRKLMSYAYEIEELEEELSNLNNPTRMVYVAIDQKDNGEEFTDATTFDLEEARKAAQDSITVQSAHDRKHSTHSIRGWEIPAAPGASAKEAFDAYMDELCWMPDPDFYEEVG